jgi:hypothetical protein
MPYAETGAPFNVSEDKMGDAVKILTREDGGIFSRHERPAFGAPSPTPWDKETGEAQEWRRKPSVAPHKLVYVLPRPEHQTAEALAEAVRAFRPNWEGTRKQKTREKKQRDNELAAQQAIEQLTAASECAECVIEGKPKSVSGRAFTYCNHHHLYLADAPALDQEAQEHPPEPIIPDAPAVSPDRRFSGDNPVVPDRRFSGEGKRHRQGGRCAPRMRRRKGHDLFTLSLMAPCARCGRPQPESEQPAVCQACLRAAGSESQQITLCPAGHTLTQGRVCWPCKDQLCGRCREAWTGFAGRNLCVGCEAARQQETR